MTSSTPSKDLLPAGILVSSNHMKITTILGSCVSLCLWDPINKYGGMNHYMLPYWNGTGLASPKFGNIALDILLRKMLALGSRKINLQAKIFGGGDVLFHEKNYFNVGYKNIQVAREFLTQHQIPIISSSTGGQVGRKIVFDTDDGVVYMKLIKRKLE